MLIDVLVSAPGVFRPGADIHINEEVNYESV